MRVLNRIIMSTKLIILFEYDINLRQSFALILERAGYHVFATDNIAKTMSIIQSGECHLIIADYDIPETMNVLLPYSQRITHQLPIVILTDQSTSELVDRDKIKNVHHLKKLIAPERLLDSVATILDMK